MSTEKYLTRKEFHREYFPEMSPVEYYQIVSKFFKLGKIPLYTENHFPASLDMFGRGKRRIFVKKTDKDSIVEIITKELEAKAMKDKRNQAPDNGIPVYDPRDDYDKGNEIWVKFRERGWQIVKIFELFNDADGDPMSRARLPDGRKVVLGRKIGHLLGK